MAKKKKGSNTPESSDSIPLKLKDYYKNETMRFILGMIVFGLALFMIFAFSSFLFTCAQDQSLTEDLTNAPIANRNHEFANNSGSTGAIVSNFFINQCFGIPAFIIPFFLVICGYKLMKAYNIVLWKWFMSCSLIMCWSSILIGFLFSSTPLESLVDNIPILFGGLHGQNVSKELLIPVVGIPGFIIIMGIIAILYLIYISNETIIIIRKILNPSNIFNKIKFEVRTGKEHQEAEPEGETKSEQAEAYDEQPNIVDFSTSEEKDEETAPSFSQDLVLTNEQDEPQVETEEVKEDSKFEIASVVEEEKATAKSMEQYNPKRDLEYYKAPTIDLLIKYEDDKPQIDMAEQNANKNRIITVLRNFGVEINSITATVGPTITLYEITPAEGVRISKIKNLEDDIALSLSALGIRIIAPIPGKGTIGIEVPNSNPRIVSMESIINSKKFQDSTFELPIALGKTITNEVFMVDLAKMPHVLVAGATGQGKSVGLNAIITSLLYKKHPAELKLVMVDPKKVEFSIYSPLEHHFLAKVPDDDEDAIITDVNKVIRTLKSLCVEMDSRYDLLKKAKARNIKEYNAKFKNRELNPENGHKFLPYIVVIIDEFGDLIMTAGKEIELPIARIAQLARAVGIHMVIATQRPTTNIITGTIKANFPARIAFRVGSMIDSRTILDRPGANQLVGRGDMLFLNGSEPVRVQCAFVDTPEVEKINTFISTQQGYVSAFELPEVASEDEGGASEGSLDSSKIDPMFEEAARLMVISQQGSTSMIQRKFSIGYNRAGRIMDQLEKAGIVGIAQGSKPRDVLIADEASLEAILAKFR